MRAIAIFALVAVALAVAQAPHPAHDGHDHVLDRLLHALSRHDITKFGDCFADDAMIIAPNQMKTSAFVSKSAFIASMTTLFSELELSKWVAARESGVFTNTTFAVNVKAMGFVNKTAVPTYPGYSWVSNGNLFAKTTDDGKKIVKYAWLSNKGQSNTTTVVNAVVPTYKAFAEGNLTGFMSHFTQSFFGYVHEKDQSEAMLNYSSLKHDISKDFSNFQVPIAVNLDNDNFVVDGKYVACQVQFLFRRSSTNTQQDFPKNIMTNAFHLWNVDSDLMISFGDIFTEDWFQM